MRAGEKRERESEQNVRILNSHERRRIATSYNIIIPVAARGRATVSERAESRTKSKPTDRRLWSFVNFSPAPRRTFLNVVPAGFAVVVAVNRKSWVLRDKSVTYTHICFCTLYILAYYYCTFMYYTRRVHRAKENFRQPKSPAMCTHTHRVSRALIGK